MSTNTPSPPERVKSSKGLTPDWARALYQQRRSSKSSGSSSRPRTGRSLTPQSTSLSTGNASDDARSIRSNRSRGRATFSNMLNRLRSSSNVSIGVGGQQLQESDFKQIEDWFLGFDRYNQLVTTHVSKDRSSESLEFARIATILSKNCGGRFLHGLPEAVFDFSLLWCPAAPSKRADTTEPSWSWTGWTGPANFPFDPTNAPDLHSMPQSEGEWFRSEILHYHTGPESAPYTIRREKERKLRIHYPPYFHAPRGYEVNADSNILRFAAYTTSADGFTAEQLHHDGKMIPCAHLMDEKEQHCGVIMDYEESISAPSSTGPFEFVLLSRNIRRAPATQTRRPVIETIHPPGTPIWDGERFAWDQEVVDHDEDIFPSGPWKMLNVMLIKWVGDSAERVAIARIHEDAWLQRNPTRKEIVLR
ncbi:hypothetical protein P154DRAFT_432152 [Amniculicola lignicola CBS 123094]|uniref:Uncharacterized protein n=1 Tax=Amniculicola lignicola CBS 123094 TaxID=1392246 RepID=A0A6A5WJU8_9PLEO|nr:hypothetical protein P154DRAFT_432152 [Amniculicola lignicola CBS 123094]